MSAFSHTPKTLIFSDYDGVINPIQPFQFDENSFVADRRQGDLDWSDELVRSINQIASNDQICWHWLTSNRQWMDWICENLDIDYSLTVTDDYGRGGYPDNKLDVIIRAIRSNDSCDATCPIIWIDDDLGKYYNNGHTMRKLRQLAQTTHSDVLMVQPNCHAGISRSQWNYVINFALHPNSRRTNSVTCLKPDYSE